MDACSKGYRAGPTGSPSTVPIKSCSSVRHPTLSLATLASSPEPQPRKQRKNPELGTT